MSNSVLTKLDKVAFGLIIIGRFSSQICVGHDEILAGPDSLSQMGSVDIQILESYGWIQDQENDGWKIFV